MDWILEFVGQKLDWNQYGGVKGSSCNHYLVDLITFILFNQDLKEPKAVLAAMVDFEKAFNRQNHHILLTKLSDMSVPGWLLNIVKGFLEDRILIVKYNGAYSESKRMPGGGPQGTILGLFLFLVQINEAGFAEQDKEIGKKITECVNKRKQLKTGHWKYVDDLTVAEALDLKKCLSCDNENKLEKPLTYHNRTKHVMPPENSKVQDQLNKISQYATDNEMKINKQKTKVMLFNTAKKRDFTPQLVIDNEIIEVVEEIKLLGVKITTDLKWNSNTEFITKKAYNKLWMLRRLKLNGANRKELLDIYLKHVRSVIENSAVVWHPGLTQINTITIERVQKAAFSVILGKDYISYDNALQVLGMKKLSERREKLCLNFAKKSFKSHKFRSWFSLDRKQVNTRRKIKTVKETKTRTMRFQKSALPYMTNLLNKAESVNHPSHH